MYAVVVLCAVAMAAQAYPAFPYAGCGFQPDIAPLNAPLTEYQNAVGTGIHADQNGIARGHAIALATTANANNHADAIAASMSFQSARNAGAAALAPGHPNAGGYAPFGTIYGQGAGYAKAGLIGPGHGRIQPYGIGYHGYGFGY